MFRIRVEQELASRANSRVRSALILSGPEPGEEKQLGQCMQHATLGAYMRAIMSTKHYRMPKHAL